MKIATWNINSIRIRLPLLARLVHEHSPDILCLQETKVMEELFPVLDVMALGYPHVVFSGQKSYNGVAIFSRIPLSDIKREDWLNNQEKRHIQASLPCGTEIHNFYVPAGGDVPDVQSNKKFADKLAFMRAMTVWSSALKKNARAILVGDLNIAPYEHDVWSHKQLLDVVSHTPIEVEHMAALRQSAQWVDTARHFTPMQEKLYSWWSYRNRDWALSNRGRRLDHIWVTPALSSGVISSATLREVRAWESTSDHVPVMLELSL
ncbi:MAG: exodeoxyribonuclease III [Rickettsiales bacterium]|nr:exodeoxyribonuclease III [Rickettsiales bacterium]